MIEFDENGFLKPYGPSRTDLDTLEQVFVNEFTTSTTRREHFERFREYNERLRVLMSVELVQWIDGSFVSRKTNPNDIDVLTFVDDQLFTQHGQALKLLKNEFDKGAGRVDAYFIRVYPDGHLYRNHYESDRVQWLFDWGRTNSRPRKNKGLIELINP